MKKRLLSMLLVLSMLLSMCPVAAMADSSAPFTAIVTNGGTSVTAQYEGTVTFANSWGSSYAEVPHYHVQLPAGTASVSVTYPSGVQLLLGEDMTTKAPYVYGYYADNSTWKGDGAQLSYTTGSDGSTVVEIPMAYSATDWDGSVTELSLVLDGNGAGNAIAPEYADGYAPVNFFTFEYVAAASDSVSVLDSAPDTAKLNTGAQLTLDLSGVFGDSADHALTYGFSADTANEHTKIVDGVFHFTSNEVGVYQITLTASCTGSKTASHKLTITVNAAPTGSAEAYDYDETPAEKVKVIATVSNDGVPVLGKDGEVMAHLEVTVPYFDLKLYGLEQYYRYGTEDGTGPYVDENVIKRPTVLHLYIYLLERYYLGLPEAECCKGTSGLLNYKTATNVYNMLGELAYNSNAESNGYHAMVPTQNAMSLYMKEFWGHDENLMYFRNHRYPLMSAGWGSTADYILLSDGDTVDVHMQSDWDGFKNGLFASFDQDSYTAAVGVPLSFRTMGAGSYSGWSTTGDPEAVTGLTVAVYDDEWIKVEEVQSETALHQYTFTETGTYYLLAEGGANVAPATAKVTVTDPYAGASFTKIALADGTVIGAVENKGTVTFANSWGSSYTNVPHYHVQIPAETEKVLVTYPSGVQLLLGEDMTTKEPYVYGYYADNSTWKGDGAQLSYTTGSDSSTVVEIPMAYSATDWDGSVTELSLVLDGNGAGNAIAPEYADGYAPVNFFTFEYVAAAGDGNSAPKLRDGVSAETTATVRDGETSNSGTTVYQVNLDTIFIEPDGEPMTYQVSIDGAAAVPADKSYSYKPQADTTTLVFTALDPRNAVSPAYTVTLTRRANQAPVVVTGAITEAAAKVSVAWTLDVSTLFTDADGDKLTYTVKVDGKDTAISGSQLSLTCDEAKTYAVAITAADDRGASATHTVSLAVQDLALTDLEMTAKPAKLHYYSGEAISTYGMKVQGTFEGGVVKELTDCTIKLDEAAGKLMVSYTMNGVTKTVETAVTMLSGTAPKAVDGVYEISTADQLIWFADHVKSGNGTADAVLTGSIDLTGKTWNPIGSEASPFAGAFDGKGFTISNLSGVNGLFAYAVGTASDYAQIKNVTVDGSIVTDAAYVAGIAGYASYADVTNCVNKADVTAGGYAGGIVGRVYNSIGTNGFVNITNCCNEGAISAGQNTGGILGYVQRGGQIKTSYNTGSVTGTENVGGVVGYIQSYNGASALTDCYNLGTVSGSSAVGGLVGNLYNAVTITNCYNAGTADYAIAGSIYISYIADHIAKVSNTYYLKTGGNAAAPADHLSSAPNIVVTAKTREEMLADTFAAALSASFQDAKCGYPRLSWQADTDHVDADKNAACDRCGASLSTAPYLIEGVASETAAQVLTGKPYDLTDLQSGRIFADPDDTLDWSSYKYQRSADGGKTWSELAGFVEAAFGYTQLQITETAEGTYLYRFYAIDSKGQQSDEAWTLTLEVLDELPLQYSFYVGRDQNYSGNGNVYPIIKLYKTAGVDKNFYDYVGWFTKGTETVYVYDPEDYDISGSAADGWKVTVDGTAYDLKDYEPIAFDEGSGTVGTEGAQKNYHMFYANLLNGKYSYRAYGFNKDTNAYDVYLGGQSLNLPTDTNVDGAAAGGTEIYLRLVTAYTNSKKTDNTYFSPEEYYIELNMPIMGGKIHAGDTYKKGNYSYYPFMMYAAGNAALYTITGYPTIDGYMYGHGINQTTTAGYTTINKTIAIAAIVKLTVTAPKAADFGLYYQWNNFNTTEVEPETATENTDGTATYVYHLSKANSNYTWRLSDPDGKYVTKAAYLAGMSADGALTVSFGSDDFTDAKAHGFDHLGSAVSLRDEADIQVFADPSGFLSLTGTHRVRAFRMWQIISSDTANIMIEPDMHIQVLQGSKSDITVVSGGNANGNWLDVKPTTTDIVAVSYDAIEINPDGYGSHGGLFPATNPERVGVFVATNEPAGTADADIEFNRSSAATSRSEEWDYNYDTWNYMNTDEAPTLDFTVVDATGSVSVSYATVITDSQLNSSLSGWTKLTADAEGKYHVDLLTFRKAKTLGGTVIIKMTDSTGTSYRLARVAEMSVQVANASNPGEPFMPGDQVKITFDGLYRSVNKVAGIFNPTTYYLRYTAGGEEVNGQLGQYQQMDRASITLTIPEDLEIPAGQSSTEYTFTNGYVFGSMYSAADPFATLYHMTDTGVGTNFNAVTVSFCIHRLADVTIEIEARVTYDLKLAVSDGRNELSGVSVTLTAPDGTALTPDANGIYQDLAYGVYAYTVMLDGYVRDSGTIKLGSADSGSVSGGVLTKSLVMEKAAANAWDGTSVSEPEADANGVYQISNGAELAWFAQTVNGGDTDASAVLAADIDLAGYSWTPIGSSTKKFAGSFDGQDHTIRNLAIDYAADNTAAPYQGLFGYVAGTAAAPASIENLTVEGRAALTSSKSVSYAYSGGVIGRADYAGISNVHADVDLTVKRVAGNWSYVGGIAGYGSNAVFTACSNTGDITGYQYAGGITGYLTGAASVITGCWNGGNITTGGAYAAGLAAASTGTIANSYNTGSVTSGGNYAGGVTANASGAATVVTNSYSTGTVTGGSSYVGGAIGYVNNAGGTVANVYVLDTAAKAAIGSVRGEQTAGTATLTEMQAEDFVDVMNTGLETPAFSQKRGGTPILSWQVTEDMIAAYAVIEQIEAIGRVTKESGEVLEAVRAAYDALTEEQKQLVDNLAVLEEAEAKYQRLINRQDPGYQIPTVSSPSYVPVVTDDMPFADAKSHWAADAIGYVYENGLMNGVSDVKFAPDATLNRAMLVTILYRLEGMPAPDGDNPFEDVADGKWYTDAVIWASENGIVNGVGDGAFAPMNSITREQFAAILYRYADYKGCGVSARADLSGYADGRSISSWAEDAMAWAAAEGLISGRSETAIAPTGTATRAEAATILMRFCENIAF